MPHTPMIRVALCRDCTKGARHIAPANTPWLIVHAVRRLGLNFSMLCAKVAIFGGGRAVKGGSSPSGLFTTNGSRTDMINVMIEKPMSASEPMRPTCPVMSFEALTEAGAS